MRGKWRQGWTLTAFALALPFACYAADDRPSPPHAGSTFQSAETQALQADETRNPGMLWVEQGAKLWEQPALPEGKTCASCHGDATASMKGVAARYPIVDAANRLLNLEGRINECRTKNQLAPALTYESNDLLGLTAYVTYQSRGLPRHVAVDGNAKPFFDAGRRFYQTRQGQMNIACAQCHDDLVGKKLRGDTISQAQTSGWPAYRLEWQAVGSLQRRLRACSLGVRAEILDFGAPEYLALELYLAWRGEGLALESPGVRR
jgi:sulfur-oxidizing protein SoxA